MPESIKHARPKRFPVLIRGRWWPLLIPFGVTQERAFVQVGERELRVCFGPLFDYRFPLEAVETVAPSRWPLWAGIGPRVDFRGTVAFVGAYENTVEVRFKERQRVRMGAPLPCERAGRARGGGVGPPPLGEPRWPVHRAPQQAARRPRASPPPPGAGARPARAGGLPRPPVPQRGAGRLPRSAPRGRRA